MSNPDAEIAISAILPRLPNRWYGECPTREELSYLATINFMSYIINWRLGEICALTPKLTFVSWPRFSGACEHLMAMDGLHLSRQGNVVLARRFKSVCDILKLRVPIRDGDNSRQTETSFPVTPTDLNATPNLTQLPLTGRSYTKVVKPNTWRSTKNTKKKAPARKATVQKCTKPTQNKRKSPSNSTSECDSGLSCDTVSVTDVVAPTPELPSECDSVLPCDTGSVTDVIVPTPGLPSECDSVLPCDTGSFTDVIAPTPGLPSECDSVLPCDTGSFTDSIAPTPGLPSECDSVLPCDAGSVTDVIAPTPGLPSECDSVLPCDTGSVTDSTSPSPGLPSECDSVLPCDTGSVTDSIVPTPGLPSECESVLPCDTGSVTDVIGPTPGLPSECDSVLPCDTGPFTDVEASQCGGGNADSDRYVTVFSENQNAIPYQKALEIHG